MVPRGIKLSISTVASLLKAVEEGEFSCLFLCLEAIFLDSWSNSCLQIQQRHISLTLLPSSRGTSPTTAPSHHKILNFTHNVKVLFAYMYSNIVSQVLDIIRAWTSFRSMDGERIALFCLPYCPFNCSLEQSNIVSRSVIDKFILEGSFKYTKIKFVHSLWLNIIPHLLNLCHRNT